MKFTDRASVGQTKETGAGYLVATSPIVRTGIQLYRADELGLVGSHTVRVMRPESEVFSQDAINSLTRIPVTLNHPAELVTADNWSELAKGELGDAWARDGDWIVVNPMIKDAAAIKAAKTTHRELSAGYTADIDFENSGDGFDATMHNFRFNHIALVPKGRAGSQARIGDADNWGASPVTTKDAVMTDFTKVVIGDKAISVATSDADIFAKIIADKDTAIGELKGQLAEAEAKILSPEDLAAKVTAMADAAMRRDAVKVKFGDEAIKDASDAEIAGMYRVIGDVKVVNDAARKTLAEMKAPSQTPSSPWDKFLPADKKGAK